MKKYIVTVPDNKRALFDEIVRENEFDVFEYNEKGSESVTPQNTSSSEIAEDIPWIDARKLIDRDAR